MFTDYNDAITTVITALTAMQALLATMQEGAPITTDHLSQAHAITSGLWAAQYALASTDPSVPMPAPTPIGLVVEPATSAS